MAKEIKPPPLPTGEAKGQGPLDVLGEVIDVVPAPDREESTITVRLGTAEEALQKVGLPRNLKSGDATFGMFATAEEQLIFARIKLGLIEDGAEIDGKAGLRPVETNMDVLRWIVRKIGGVSTKKRTHKANGLKND